MKTLLAVAAALTLLTTAAQAELKTVTLAVSGMTCATCPITVKKALTKVDGVTKVDVDYDKRQVVVTYDDAKTSIEALTKATADAGYPSTPKS